MKISPVEKLLGSIPNRLQLAGGWIDQPFVSRHNPKPPGSMVVVQIEPDFRPMDRSGIASGTRHIAMKLWKGKLPNRPLEELVRELYDAENQGKAEPSGSQDMIGLIYPGVNRLDYDFKIQGGVFTSHIESCNSSKVAKWLSASASRTSDVSSPSTSCRSFWAAIEVPIPQPMAITGLYLDESKTNGVWG